MKTGAIFLIAGLIIGAFISPQIVSASEATKPIAGQRFISLHSAKNLMIGNKPTRVDEQRFFSLARGNKMFPIAKSGSAGPKIPMTSIAKSHPETPLAPKNPAPAIAMNRTQANQLLSLFAEAD